MNNDTVQRRGYVTNLITDVGINWLENRERMRPNLLLYSWLIHKAVHRDWLPEIKNLSLYEDKIFPLPDSFFDDYNGRLAAAAQEMSIAEDMDIIYDLKMLRQLGKRVV